MNVEPQRLKKFLVDAELVSAADFDAALEISVKTNKKVGEVLVSKKLIDQEKLTKFEAYLLGIPFVNLGQEAILPEILNIIPEQIARAHNIIAFRKVENNLEVAMLDPEDLTTIEFIKKQSPLLKILPRLTTPEGIKNALRQYQKTLDIEFGDIMGKSQDMAGHIEKNETPSEALVREIKEEVNLKVISKKFLLRKLITQKQNCVLGTKSWILY